MVWGMQIVEQIMHVTSESRTRLRRAGFGLCAREQWTLLDIQQRFSLSPRNLKGLSDLEKRAMFPHRKWQTVPRYRRSGENLRPYQHKLNAGDSLTKETPNTGTE
jgi:hypothetical protein